MPKETKNVGGPRISIIAWGKRKKENQGAEGVLNDLDEAEHMQQAKMDAMGAATGARDYELENIARHKNGELNTAELGFENMKHAMNDPSALAGVLDAPVPHSSHLCALLEKKQVRTSLTILVAISFCRDGANDEGP